MDKLDEGYEFYFDNIDAKEPDIDYDDQVTTKDYL